MNGATVYVGRARNSILAGRANPVVAWGTQNGGFAPNANGAQFWPTTWPRTAGVCAPITQCCCAGPVFIAPGEVRALTINWAQWIDSAPGFAIDSVYSASLSDPSDAMNPADPDVIKVVSGFRTKKPPLLEPRIDGNGNGNGGNGNGNEDNDGDLHNADVSEFIQLVPPYGTLVLIEAAFDARIGAQFKLDICLVAHDCDGRRIRQCQCVVLTVAEC